MNGSWSRSALCRYAIDAAAKSTMSTTCTVRAAACACRSPTSIGSHLEMAVIASATRARPTREYSVTIQTACLGRCSIRDGTNAASTRTQAPRTWPDARPHVVRPFDV